MRILAKWQTEICHAGWIILTQVIIGGFGFFGCHFEFCLCLPRLKQIGFGCFLDHSIASLYVFAACFFFNETGSLLEAVANLTIRRSDSFMLECFDDFGQRAEFNPFDSGPCQVQLIGDFLLRSVRPEFLPDNPCFLICLDPVVGRPRIASNSTGVVRTKVEFRAHVAGWPKRPGVAVEVRVSLFMRSSCRSRPDISRADRPRIFARSRVDQLSG